MVFVSFNTIFSTSCRTLAATRALVELLPRRKNRPTAIYAHGDDFALPLLQALGEAGLRVPSDFALLGTDDLPYSEMSTPALSMIRFDEGGLGLRAVAMINSLILVKNLDGKFNSPPAHCLVARDFAYA
jgi:DNA-binding LacI/PurR family transcriptional regulator